MADEVKSVPWKERKAWLVRKDATVESSLLDWWLSPKHKAKNAGRPLRGFAVAIALAAEFGVKKLGARKYDPAAGRDRGWTAEDGGFAARPLANGDALIVEGPPDSTGELPYWGVLEHRDQVEVKEYPGVFEMVEPGAKPE